MHKHFVTFFSPGTFLAETTTKAIESWDVEQAKEMVHEIIERYDATPYAFQFLTRARSDSELDSKTTEKSPYYFLGGKIETLEEIETRNDPKDKILISNMKCNGWGRIVRNTNSWQWTQPLEENDQVLDWKPRKGKVSV